VWMTWRAMSGRPYGLVQRGAAAGAAAEVPHAARGGQRCGALDRADRQGRNNTTHPFLLRTYTEHPSR
jgi:hypothetical protein